MKKAVIVAERPEEHAWAWAYAKSKGLQVTDEYNLNKDTRPLHWLHWEAKDKKFELILSRSGLYTDAETEERRLLAEVVAGLGIEIVTAGELPPPVPLERAKGGFVALPRAEAERKRADAEARRAEQEAAAAKIAVAKQDASEQAKTLEEERVARKKLRKEADFQSMMSSLRGPRLIDCPKCGVGTASRDGDPKADEPITCSGCNQVFTVGVATKAKKQRVKPEVERRLVEKFGKDDKVPVRDSFGNITAYHEDPEKSERRKNERRLLTRFLSAHGFAAKPK